MAVTSGLGIAYPPITRLPHWSPGLYRSDILGSETNWRQVPESKQGELGVCTHGNWEKISPGDPGIKTVVLTL